MTGALPEVHNCAFRHPRRFAIIGLVTPWTRRAGAAAVAGMYAFPRFVRVVLANPATILAESAIHCMIPGLKWGSIWLLDPVRHLRWGHGPFWLMRIDRARGEILRRSDFFLRKLLRLSLVREGFGQPCKLS
jgi:hypothetical protein